MYSLNIGKIEDKIGHTILISVAFLGLIQISHGYIDCRISCRRCHENTEHPSVLEVYCAMCEECKQRRREKIQGKTGSLPEGSVPVPEAIAAAKAATIGGSSSSPLEPAVLLATTVPVHVPHQGRSGRVRHASVMRDGVEDDDTQGIPTPRGNLLPGLPAGQPIIIQGAPMAIGFPAGCPPPPYCSESEEEVTMRVTETTTTTTTTTTTPPPTTTKCPTPPPCKKKRIAAPMPYAMAPMMPMMVPCMPCMNMCQTPCQSIPPPTTVAMLTQPPTPSTVKIDYQYVYIGIPKNALRTS